MANTPIGNGPPANHVGMGPVADTKGGDALQFRAQDKGSMTTELLRGKIGQLRMAKSDHTAQGQPPGFRELLSPHPSTQRLIALLQRHA